MATPHEEYLDASLRHRIALRRYTAGEIRRLLELLEEADADLVAQVRARLARLGSREDTRIRRLRELINEVGELRREAFAELRERLGEDLVELGKVEAAAELDLLTGVLPFQVELTAVPAAQVRALVTKEPILGLSLGQWFEDLAATDRTRLVAAIQQSFAQGETIEQAARRLSGTRASGYTDGALSITRRNAVAVARTAISHVANRSREMVWQGTEGAIDAVRWVSTLDGRTSPVCRSRDGKVFPMDEGPRPPAHYQCRSVVVAVLDGAKLVGERPSVVDTRTRRRREIDFRAMAKEQAGADGWKALTPAQRNERIRAIRTRWARDRVGSVPAQTTYAEWLRRQDRDFIGDVLGKKRADLFLRGGLSLDEFVDFRGVQIPLSELRKKYKSAFAATED